MIDADLDRPATRRDLLELERRQEIRFGAADERFNGIDERFAQVEPVRLGTCDHDDARQRLDSLESAHGRRLDNAEARLTAIELRKHLRKKR